MATRTFDARIVWTGDDCSIHYANDTYVYRELKSVFKDGEKVSVEFKSRRKPRSIKQNAVLHWYINEIADETGMSSDSIKEALRYKFLSVDATDKNGDIIADVESGEVLKIYRSTTDLSTIDMMDFLEQIRMWSRDFLMMELPLPNEETELKFK